MDPERKLFTVFFVMKSKMYEFLPKVVLAFKGEPFGRSWLGIFRPQGGALWLENSWIDHSSKGSLLLRSVVFGFGLESFSH